MRDREREGERESDHYCGGGCVSIKPNDRMAVGASQALAYMACCAPSGSPPIDEKEVITYHFLSVLPHSVAHAWTVQTLSLRVRVYSLARLDRFCL